MNILVSCGHPAQYHFFKNALRLLKQRGHNVKLLIKSKDVLESLVKEDGWDYVNIQQKYRGNSKPAILMASFKRTAAIVKIARKFKPDILAGTESGIAQAGWLLGKPSFTTLEDDVEIIANLARLTYPFTRYILVPNVCRVGKWESKKIGYEGYMKLAYLHPNYFTPNTKVLEQYGIEGDYILIRLAKLTAHHDTGIKGLNTQLVMDIISKAESSGMRAYISSEIPLSEELEPYRLGINPVDIHHIMAFSKLLVSDSQSMSVEAAMLGVPSLRFSDFAGRISVLEELENVYGLTFGIKTYEPERLLTMTTDILSDEKREERFKSAHTRLLDDKIDVTAMMVDLFENYPESLKKYAK